mgnify:CR=1 FL=1
MAMYAFGLFNEYSIKTCIVCFKLIVLSVCMYHGIVTGAVIGLSRMTTQNRQKSNAKKNFLKIKQIGLSIIIAASLIISSLYRFHLFVNVALQQHKY